MLRAIVTRLPALPFAIGVFLGVTSAGSVSDIFYFGAFFLLLLAFLCWLDCFFSDNLIKTALSPLLVVLVFALTGFIGGVFSMTFSSYRSLEQLSGGKISLACRVESATPSIGWGERLYLSAIEDSPPICEGMLFRVYADPEREILPGDFVNVSGVFSLSEPALFPNDTDWRIIDWSRGIAGAIKSAKVNAIDRGKVTTGAIDKIMNGILLWRLKLKEHILLNTPPSVRGYLMAGVLGERGSFHAEELFRNTGTTHLLAVSGLHMSLVVMTVWLMLRRIISAGTSFVAAIFLTVIYWFTAGCSPSVTRAGIMLLTALSAVIIGRKGASLNALMLAFGAMLLAKPFSLWSVGFQLSFAATVGVIIASNISDELQGGGFVSFIMISFLAWLFTLPLIAYHFSSVSMGSLLSNFIAVPLFSYGFILALLGILCSFIAETLAAPFFWLGGVIFILLESWLRLSFEAFRLSVEFNWIWVAPVLGLILSAVFLFIAKSRDRAVLLLIPVLTCALIWCSIYWKDGFEILELSKSKKVGIRFSEGWAFIASDQRNILNMNEGDRKDIMRFVRWNSLFSNAEEVLKNGQQR